MTEPTAAPPRGPIRYFAPLERAWHRMVAQLFRPFDVGRWIVLGFSCWLARFIQGGGGGPGFNIPSGGGNWSTEDADAAGLADLADRADLTDLPRFLDRFDPADLVLPGFLGCLIVGVLLVILVLIPLLIWLGSRGQFLFLDNVVHGRAEIKRPWKEYRREGNSLFLFQLALLGIGLVSLVVVMLPGILFLIAATRDAGEPSGGAIVAAVLALVLPLLAWMVVAVYVGFFLLAFVVPIMHRERLTTVAAWRLFLPLFRAEWPHFLLVGLFVLALHVFLTILTLVVGIATCCIFFIVLIIPFVGTVALLPVWVTLRAYTLEFLAQFSPRFDLFAGAAGGGGGEAGALPTPATPA